ncbi:MAG: hypothetical protein ABIL58_18380 [Pseudomonadota bacterium]
MKLKIAVIGLFLFCATQALAAEFGSPGGPEPANLDQASAFLRTDPVDLELLISFGTSKGGSAGHLALAVRGQIPDDDLVYSANFYADRTSEHASGFYTRDLMLRIPKMEYLFKTTSSLGETASFGLDFGEIYKRAVIGVRVYGVPAPETAALVDFFKRINDDYHRQAKNTEYHTGKITYDYMQLNCAKTIGSAFKFGAGYTDLDVSNPALLTGLRAANAVRANIPTEMAIRLIKQWNQRGYGMDVVLYKKYEASTYVDPHEAEKVQFKDLPNRFPSVLSLDFRREQGAYEDFDNLFAMYLLYNMGKYSIRVNAQTLLLEVEKSKRPMAYREAAELATRNATADSEGFLRRSLFEPQGRKIGDPVDNTHLYNFTEESAR